MKRILRLIILLIVLLQLNSCRLILDIFSPYEHRYEAKGYYIIYSDCEKINYDKKLEFEKLVRQHKKGKYKLLEYYGYEGVRVVTIISDGENIIRIFDARRLKNYGGSDLIEKQILFGFFQIPCRVTDTINIKEINDSFHIWSKRQY